MGRACRRDELHHEHSCAWHQGLSHGFKLGTALGVILGALLLMLFLHLGIWWGGLR